MKQRMKSEQLLSALRFLDALALRSKGRLPTIPRMAESAGVSVSTMWKAVQELKRAGALSVAQRRGTYVAQGEQQARPKSAEGEVRGDTPPVRTESLLLRVQRDILTGVFTAGQPLPSPKLLRQRYGVSHRTLARTLAASGLVERYKRGYRIPSVGVSPSTNRILTIAICNSDGVFESHTENRYNIVRALEQECLNNDIAMTTVGYDFRSVRWRPAIFNRFKRERALRESVLGAVVFTAKIPRDAIGEVLRLLHELRQPVALLDDIGGSWLPSPDAAQSLNRAFVTSNPASSGAQMGRYLLSLGHQHAVFLSPHHDSPWSQNWCRGLAETFEAAGARVDIVTAARVPEPAGFSESNSLSHTVVRALARQSDHFSERFLSLSWERVMAGIVGEMHRFALHETVAPLVDRAMAIRGATVLVCANDATAIECMTFLGDKRIRVPTDLSVVGFDNIIESYAHQLTTYDYNGNAAVRALLNHVLTPSRARPRRAPQIAEIKGMIVERGSARTCPSAERQVPLVSTNDR